MLRARNRFVQGYNAQASVTEDHVVVAAEVTNAANDSTMFGPMLDATEVNLEQAGGSEPVGAYVADAGYWSVPNVTRPTDADVLIKPLPATNGVTDPPTSRRRPSQRPQRSRPARQLRALRKQMLERLASDDGRIRYAKRKITVEPVFGNITANLRFRRFSRRSEAAVLSEWRLICSVHNLLKLHSVKLATT